MSDTKISKNKKTRYIAFIILIFCLVLLAELTTVMGDMDEIWNYNLSRGITMGFVPYRDFNMVMMPLYHLLFAIPLSFSRQLIVFRLTSAFFRVLTYACFYKICIKYIDHMMICFLCVSSILFDSQYTYNSLFFLFAILFMLILMNESSDRFTVLLGVVGTLAALSRQTSGTILLIIGIIIIMKNPRSLRLRRTLSYFAGVGITGLVFLIYLLVTNSFTQFWDYCFFALFQSGGNGVLFEVFAVPALLITIAGCCADFCYYRRDKDINRIFHIIIGLSITSVIIPRIDAVHVVYSGLWFMIPILEYVSTLITIKRTSLVSAVLTAVMSFTVMFTCIARTQNTILSDEFKELRSIPMTENITCGYATVASQNKHYEEEGYNVTTFLHEAALISIMNGEFNPPYDLFLKGNLGTVDPMFYVEESCTGDNSIIICSDEPGLQMPDGIREYIEENCEPIATYAQFTWYISK